MKKKAKKQGLYQQLSTWVLLLILKYLRKPMTSAIHIVLGARKIPCTKQYRPKYIVWLWELLKLSFSIDSLHTYLITVAQFTIVYAMFCLAGQLNLVKHVMITVKLRSSPANNTVHASDTV